MAQNVHATAIVVGSSGLLFIGDSGSGKSERAFACMNEATSLGHYCALVADDQVLVSARGGVVLAEAPRATAGLLELRGTGIVRLPALGRAVMHVAVLCARPGEEPRLPEGSERHSLGPAGELPLVRLQSGLSVLAAIAAICPQVPGSKPSGAASAFG